MKSDFDLLKNNNKMISNGEALSEQSDSENSGLHPPPLQLKKKGSGFTNGHNSSSVNKAIMPLHVKEKMEDSFGHDFSNVSIHQNSGQAKSLNAKAFTQGNQIHFAPGEYKPNQKSGQELLGHELTHVVQQREKNIPVTTQLQGTGINDNHAFEKEADDKGRAAATGKTIGVNKPGAKNSNVEQPVVQGFIMGSLHKVFKSSIKSVVKDQKFFLNKMKKKFNSGKKLLNKATGIGSIVGDLTSFFKRAGNAIQDIISNPIGFITNLLGAIKEGFLKFFGNITKHLLSGLTKWLLSALSGAGINIPNSFSLKALLSMAYQILTKVWALIRIKLIGLIGKKALKYGDEVAQVLYKLVQVGPKAIWNVFKAKVTETYNTKR